MSWGNDYLGGCPKCFTGEVRTISAPSVGEGQCNLSTCQWVLPKGFSMTAVEKAVHAVQNAVNREAGLKLQAYVKETFGLHVRLAATVQRDTKIRGTNSTPPKKKRKRK